MKIYLILHSISNGKSAVLNAVLGFNVLPSSSGHTTDSLLVLSGVQTEGYQYTVKQETAVNCFEVYVLYFGISWLNISIKFKVYGKCFRVPLGGQVIYLVFMISV